MSRTPYLEDNDRFLRVPPWPDRERPQPTTTVELTPPSVGQARAHVFRRDELLAINAALAARRPLLVRGEPGTGKSQLAVAAAEAMGRALIPHAVDARTETRDLLYTVDDVARLAEAQVQGAVWAHHSSVLDGDDQGGRRDTRDDPVRSALAIHRFVTPGPLWWAFNWSDALSQAEQAQRADCKPHQPPGWQPGHGSVVLIDEIDKADSAIPNGLLDAFGRRAFLVTGPRQVTLAEGTPPPLVVITSNEERALPDAFVRRCFVLHLRLPDTAEPLQRWLVDRGRAHFPEQDLSTAVLEHAAQMLVEDRLKLPDHLARPGVAEYIDLLRVVKARGADDAARQALLTDLREFALDKNAWLRRGAAPR